MACLGYGVWVKKGNRAWVKIREQGKVREGRKVGVRDGLGLGLGEQLKGGYWGWVEVKVRDREWIYSGSLKSNPSPYFIFVCGVLG